MAKRGILPQEVIDAIESSDVSVLRNLYEQGKIDVKARNEFGKNMWYVAINENASNEVLRLLHDWNVDFDLRYSLGSCWTSIVVGDKRRILDFLLDNRVVDVSKFPRNSGHESPLGLAVIWGRLYIVEKLIAFGTDVNLKGDSGTAPIHSAACGTSEFRIPILDLLLINGADLESEDLFGHTPLRFAVVRRDVEMVRALLSRGASPFSNVETDGSFELSLQTSDQRIRVLIERVRLALVLSSARTVIRLGIRAPIRRLPVELIRKLVAYH